jgi:arylsulfatase A-like enzyme
VCLLGTLIAAKAITLLGQDVPASAWALAAYVWQDVLIAGVFFAVDASLRRNRIGWVMYTALIAYVAINVPVTRVLSTPLTWTVIRAAGGPLADSIAHYVTPLHLAALVVPLAAGVLLPWLLSRRAITIGAPSIALAIAVAIVGCIGVSRVDTRGLHRSALGALVATGIPRMTAAPGSVDWRLSPFAAAHGENLTSLGGSLAGRNVILIVLESTAARHLGLYGAAVDPMPNLTDLGRHGVVFDRTYSVYPESIKGLFATLCSRYPAFDLSPEAYRDVPCTSLPRSLKDAGYRTALFHSGRFVYLGMEAVIRDRGFDRLEDAGDIGGRINSSFGVDEASTVDRMLRWIDSLDRRDRFFLTYLPIAGHHPYSSAGRGPFHGNSDFTAYLNALHEGDEALGRFISGLRERHLDENSVFVVFGDHGEAFGEHPGNFAHTLFIYDENVRVPYLIAAPGKMRSQVRVERVASIIDTAPTVLDLLGLRESAGHQGTSLLRPEPRMALFYTDYSLGWLGLRDACWKYLYEMDARRSRLFDICADPGERHDRAGDFPDRVAAYRTRVEGWAAAQKDAIERRQPVSRGLHVAGCDRRRATLAECLSEPPAELAFVLQ